MSSNALNVIALISGGKDSLFSILHCLKNGHNIVALGNLYPARSLSGEHNEDSDSFMYQTIGHSLVPLYADCLDIPLYREEIRGGAVDASANYSPNADGDDETESLVPLLARIKAAHPNANALSTGAILSSYQRTRIESVALRLGLAPLAYLWQYPLLPPYSPTSLLQDMAAVGQDARIIKVASGGLHSGHLWLDVADPKTVRRLVRDMGRYDGVEMLLSGSVLGEGGEYETLAVDGPGVLWKRRIVVEEGQRGVVLGGGGNAAVRIGMAKTVEKEHGDNGTGLDRLRVPDVLDVEFEAILAHITEELHLENQPIKKRALDPNHGSSKATAHYTTAPLQSTPKPDSEPSCLPSTLYISNLASSIASFPTLLRTLRTTLALDSLTPSDITHSTLLLRDISTFATINETYATLFPCPLPPSRVTVSVGDLLPRGVDVSASFVIRRATPATPTRKGLHVQSRSYWAPANIGPYSQAICAAELVYVAGQIPLVPASMALPAAGGFELQAVLGLQHLWRVGRATRVGWWTGAMVFLARVTGGDGGSGDRREIRRRARVVGEVWRAAHARPDADGGDEDDDDDEQFDVADAALRRGWGNIASQRDRGGSSTRAVVDGRPQLPDWDCVRAAAAGEEVEAPPCFVVEVEGLPRDADVEWSSVGIAVADGGCVCVDSGVIIGKDSRRQVRWEALRTQDDWIEHASKKDTTGERFLEVYTSVGVPEALEVDGTTMRVPCRSVWTSAGEAVDAVVKIWMS